MKFASYLIKRSRIPADNFAAFTIVELIVSVVIIGILASLSVPSTISWRRNQILNGFTTALRSEITLISEEAKRFGSTCRIQFNSYSSGGTPFKVDCQAPGSIMAMAKCNNASTCNITSLSSLISSYPISSNNNNLLYINSNVRSFSFTPRGQLGGLSDITITVSASGYLGSQLPTRCIIVKKLTGAVEHGFFNGVTRSLALNQSSFNSSINPSRCIT
jgi:type II secretory pathway pseudopilin PulG